MYRKGTVTIFTMLTVALGGGAFWGGLLGMAGMGAIVGAGPAGVRAELPDAQAAVQKVSIAPAQGPVGTVVTIKGSGFSASSTVLLDGFPGAKEVGVSPDGSSVRFTVPQFLGEVCPPQKLCGDYMLLVRPGAELRVTVLSPAGRRIVGRFDVAEH